MAQVTPAHLYRKTLQSMDPFTNAPTPGAFGYSTSRAIRDLPFNHPLMTMGAGALLLAGPQAVMAPLIGAGYAAASLYSTFQEAVSLAPTMARFLERVGTPAAEYSAPMVDTRASASMRQASLRAIHDSGYHLRSVLTKEARLMHR